LYAQSLFSIHDSGVQIPCRKLAVQEEQQRLEAEVQRLREQIREDAETHRRARQEKHDSQGIAEGERRDPRSTTCLPAEADARGPCLEGKSPLGVLREIRHSNWQEKQGLPRPRSAGRPSAGQRYCDQNGAEVDGRERREKPSELGLGRTTEERDRECGKGGGGQGSRKGPLRAKPSAPVTSSFLKAAEGRTRDGVQERKTVQDLKRGMESLDGRPSLAAEAEVPDTREVLDGPLDEEPVVSEFESGPHKSLRRAESDHPGRADDERATDRVKVPENLPPNVGISSDFRRSARNAMGEGEKIGEKHLSNSANVSSTSSRNVSEAGLYQGEAGNAEGAENVEEQRSKEDPKAAATASNSLSPTEVEGKAEGMETAELAALARQQAEVAARKR
jgi:hypothetical protein